MANAWKILNDEIYYAKVSGDREYLNRLLERKEMLKKFLRYLRQNGVKEWVINKHLEGLINEVVEDARRDKMKIFPAIWQVKREIYKFAKKRGFRYGLNRRYISKHLNAYRSAVDMIVDYLVARKEVWILRMWGNEYVFPRRRKKRHFAVFA